MKLSRFTKPNFIDLIADGVIGYFIGKKFGIAVGFYSFGIAVSLNQIIWLLAELIKLFEAEKE